MTRYRLIGCLALGLAVGCAQRIDWSVAPELRPGVDECDECHMLINDLRYAAMVRLADRQPRRFDDIVCLERFRTAHAAEIAQYWFHDFPGGHWLRETEASLVTAPAIHTPMGSGTMAFADPGEADKLAATYSVTPRPAAEVFAPPGP